MEQIKAIKPSTLEGAIGEAINGLFPRDSTFKVQCDVDNLDFIDDNEVILVLTLTKAGTK